MSSTGAISSLEGAAYVLGAGLAILIIAKLIQLILPAPRKGLKMSDTDGNQRLLGSMEKVLDKGQKVLTFTSTGTFIISYKNLEYDALKTKLKQALHIAVERQPLLRSVICENDDNKEYFKVIDSEEIDQQFQVIHNSKNLSNTSTG